MNKTEILRLGTLKKTEFKVAGYLKFRWKSDYVTVLGVQISTDKDEMGNMNYRPKIEKK